MALSDKGILRCIDLKTVVVEPFERLTSRRALTTSLWVRTIIDRRLSILANPEFTISGVRTTSSDAGVSRAIVSLVSTFF